MAEKTNITFDPAKEYDVAIAGGGLAGLSLAIQLRKQGYTIILFEKEQYPFHRVCGEYLSLESLDFLRSLGFSPEAYDLPGIKKLFISASNGRSIEHVLPLGGIGVSRYLLDHSLARTAIDLGVIVREDSKVEDIVPNGKGFRIQTTNGIFKANLAAGCFGKKSNVDTRWQRPFVTKPAHKKDNFIGVKYHIKTDFPEDTIALHLFEGGYCGLVKIEGDKYNLCYLTNAAQLKKANGNLEYLENNILSKNPFLKKVFNNSHRYQEKPVTISQVSFAPKSNVERGILMLGDASGMITPLCGNGMSMALHASGIAAELIHLYLSGRITKEQMEKEYSDRWEKNFARRLWVGRRLQHVFEMPVLMNLLLGMSRIFPPIVSTLIGQTHGKPF